MSTIEPCPNLIIMGAQKSGTTSLYEYMKPHPEIFMSSPIKEPGFYLGDERAKIFWQRMGQPIASRHELLHERMLNGYQGERWFGDASTYYTIGKRSRMFEVPQRMQQQNPAMRFIYILRNPVERIVSNYLHCSASGRYQGPIEGFMETGEGRNSLLTSLYHYQLQAYLEHFSKAQFCVLVFEEFLADPRQGMDAIWSFLSLQPPPNQPNYGRHNVSSNRQLHSADALKLPQQDLQKVEQAVCGDVASLEKFLGRKITAWPQFS